jgi:lipid-A-disaccharide synthase
VPHIALANIVAGEAVAPEFIQERCSAALLSDALGELLDDEAARALQTRRYRETAKNVGLGDTLPSERAAQAVLDILDRADGTT